MSRGKTMPIRMRLCAFAMAPQPHFHAVAGKVASQSGRNGKGSMQDCKALGVLYVFILKPCFCYLRCQLSDMSGKVEVH